MDYNSESFHPMLLGFILSYDYTMVRRYNHKEKHGKHLVFMTYVRPHKIDQARVWMQISKFQFFFRHLHGDLNLDEIKNRLRLLPVNRETNLMNLIGL